MGKSFFLSLLLLILSACYSPVITPQGFENIQAGETIDTVIETFGPPYEVENLPNGFQEYTYLQRTTISPGVIDQVAYILYVCKGKVISKSIRCEQSTVDLNFQ